MMTYIGTKDIVQIQIKILSSGLIFTVMREFLVNLGTIEINGCLYYSNNIVSEHKHKDERPPDQLLSKPFFYLH